MFPFWMQRVQCLQQGIVCRSPGADAIIATLPFAACIFMKNYPFRMKFSMTGFGSKIRVFLSFFSFGKFEQYPVSHVEVGHLWEKKKNNDMFCLSKSM